MNNTSPFSVCISFDGKENDNKTNLACPCGGDETIQARQNADPNYCNELDGAYLSQMHQPRSLSRPDQILTDIDSLDDMQQQELLDLKLQIDKQKEEIERLSLENEVIKAEKTSLIDDLALARNVIEERCLSSSMPRRFSLPGFGIGANNGNGGSMQMLLDTNAKLMTENDRLQVSEDGIRRSFQSYMKDSLRSSSDRDMLTIKTLQRENERLQHQWLSVSEKFTPDLSERTAKASLESSVIEENEEDLLDIDSSQHSTKESMLMNSLHSIPEQEFKFGTSGDDWVIDGEDIEAIDIGAICNKAARSNSMPMTSKEIANILAKRPAARSKSEALLVDFGEPEARRSKRADRRLYHSLTEGNAHSKSEILLVGFGEVRRSGRMTRRWSSLKL